MAQITLVMREDGERLINRISREGIEWTAVFWRKEDETDRWVFYIVTPLVPVEGGTKNAYRRIGPLVTEMRQNWLSIDPLEFKVIGPHDPICEDLQSHSEFYVYPKNEELFRSLAFAAVALGYVLMNKANPWQMQRSGQPRKPDRSFALNQIDHALESLNLRLGINGYSLEERISSLRFSDAPAWQQTAIENVMKAEILARNRPEADQEGLHLLGEAMRTLRNNLPEEYFPFKKEMAEVWPERPVAQT